MCSFRILRSKQNGNISFFRHQNPMFLSSHMEKRNSLQLTIPHPPNICTTFENTVEFLIKLTQLRQNIQTPHREDHWWIQLETEPRMFLLLGSSDTPSAAPFKYLNLTNYILQSILPTYLGNNKNVLHQKKQLTGMNSGQRMYWI